MLRTIAIFVITGLVVATFALWAVNSTDGLNGSLMIGGIALIILVAGLLVGLGRARSVIRKEPVEDEMTKRVMTRASSLSYYISIYLWLAIMYISDKIEWESHTLIGAGILGMAIVFLLSWLGVKFLVPKNG